MKTKLLIAFLFFSVAGRSQLTDVALETVSPFCLIQVGNYIFIAEANAGRISKIDINSTSTTPIVVFENMNAPSSFALSGSTIYVAQRFADKISKFDAALDNPVLIDVATGIPEPISISLNGNELYIAQRSLNKIMKINVTNTNPVAVDVVTGLSGPRYLANNGTDLFICENIAHKISKFNMADTAPATTDVSNTGSANGIMLNGEELYICESATGTITKIELSDTSPTESNVVSGADQPVSTIIVNGILYIAEFAANKVSKYTLPLRTSQFSPGQSPAIVPNPVADYFSVSNLQQQTQIQVYDAFGRKISEQVIGVQNRISMENVANGNYFLQIAGGKTLRIIKQ